MNLIRTTASNQGREERGDFKKFEAGDWSLHRNLSRLTFGRRKRDERSEEEAGPMRERGEKEKSEGVRAIFDLSSACLFELILGQLCTCP